MLCRKWRTRAHFGSLPIRYLSVCSKRKYGAVGRPIQTVRGDGDRDWGWLGLIGLLGLAGLLRRRDASDHNRVVIVVS